MRRKKLADIYSAISFVCAMYIKKCFTGISAKSTCFSLFCLSELRYFYCQNFVIFILTVVLLKIKTVELLCEKVKVDIISPFQFNVE